MASLIPRPRALQAGGRVENMHLETMNPTAPGRASMGFGRSLSPTASTSENSIPAILVNRLRQRFGLSELHAATVLRLASIGPQEGRS